MKTIPLGDTREAMVDDEDYEVLCDFKWFYADGGAARDYKHPETGKRARQAMHRVLCETGPRLEVQHIDGNRLNNQRENLRAVNPGNLRRHSAGRSASGYKGVYKCNGDYVAQISVDGHVKYLGIYKTEIDAALAYDRAALEYTGPTSRRNFNDITVPPTAAAKREAHEVQN